MTREKQIQKAIIAYLEAKGFWVRNIAGTAWGHAGDPDILACRDGRLWAIECKQPGEQPTRIQEHRLASLRAAGAVVLVASSRSEVAEAVEDFYGAAL